MSVEAPEAPAAPPAEPAAPAATPAAPPPAQQQQAPDGPAAPAQPETDWKAQAETARAEADRLKAESTAAKADYDRIKSEADRWKAQSRQQEARSKANHSEVRVLTDVVRELAVKAGVDFDDKPNPEEVSRRLSEMTAQARQLTVERAVYLSAARSGADPVALLDSREFLSRAQQADPDAADFDLQVADLVREAAKDSRFQLPAAPSLTPQVTQAPAQQQPSEQFQQPPAQPPASSSGADFSGAPGHGSRWTAAQYEEYMRTAHMYDRDGKKLTEAIKRGELIDLGIGQPRGSRRR